MKTFNEHIVKVGSQYELKSKTTGRNLGKYPTKAGAEKRERQVQYFKHANEDNAVMPSYTKEETLDEISAKTLDSYRQKAFADNDPKNQEKRSKGRRLAFDKMVHKNAVKVPATEEVEAIDEISKDTLRSYANKAFAHGNDLHYDIAHTQDKDEKAKMKAKLSKRNDGVIKASQKLNREATDTVKKDANGKIIAWSHEGDWEKNSTKNKQGSGKAANLAGKALQQTKKLAKEEVEEFVEAIDHKQRLRDALDRHTEKAVAANKAGDHDAVKVHQGYMNKIKNKMAKLAKNEDVDYAEVEALCELDKKTLGSYVNKAHDQLMKHTSTVNFKQGRGDSDAFAYAHDDTAVRKTANRTQGVKTAISKLTKEEVEEFMQTEAYEQLDELDKETLKSYVKKAKPEIKAHDSDAEYSKRIGDTKGTADSRRKSWNREVGLNTAKAKMGHKHDSTLHGVSGKVKATEEVNKLTKEDTMLTYSEFMAQLAEGKADDLRDKLAADREARLNNYDYSKEKHAKKSPVQKVKGHSYGAGEEEGEDDEGTTRTEKPASEKRGRGRPAGSKSGARV